MRLIVKTTNTTLTPAMARLIADKLENITRLLGKTGKKSATPLGGREVLEARVEVGKATRHHKKGPYFRAEVNINYQGKELLRAEANMPTLALAMDEVKKELKLSVVSWKERQRDSARSGARRVKMRMRERFGK